jgi:hypothetical protein
VIDKNKMDGRVFDYPEKALYKDRKIVICGEKIFIDDKQNSIIATMIGGRRYYLLHEQDGDKNKIIYLNENLDVVLVKKYEKKCEGQIQILNDTEILYQEGKTIRWRKYHGAYQHFILYQTNRYPVYRIDDDNNITIVQIEGEYDKTVFTITKRKKILNGYDSGSVHHHTIDYYFDSRNLLFFEDVDLRIIEYYIENQQCIGFVRKIKDGFDVVAVHWENWINVDKWVYENNKLVRHHQFRIDNGDIYRLLIYFNKKYFFHEKTAIIATELYQDWRKRTIKLLMEDRRLKMLASSLLEMIIDYVAS